MFGLKGWLYIILVFFIEFLENILEIMKKYIITI